MLSTNSPFNDHTCGLHDQSSHLTRRDAKGKEASLIHRQLQFYFLYGKKQSDLWMQLYFLKFMASAHWKPQCHLRFSSKDMIFLGTRKKMELQRNCYFKRHPHRYRGQILSSIQENMYGYPARHFNTQWRRLLILPSTLK